MRFPQYDNGFTASTSTFKTKCIQLFIFNLNGRAETLFIAVKIMQQYKSSVILKIVLGR